MNHYSNDAFEKHSWKVVSVKHQCLRSVMSQRMVWEGELHYLAY